jgi:hypothetical protein
VHNPKSSLGNHTYSLYYIYTHNNSVFDSRLLTKSFSILIPIQLTNDTERKTMRCAISSPIHRFILHISAAVIADDDDEVGVDGADTDDGDDVVLVWRRWYGMVPLAFNFDFNLKFSTAK